MSLVANQFALWLNTRGIKPGDMGEINGSNFTSGISKIMDELDTSESCRDQIPFFVNAERRFWNLIFKNMMPVWSRSARWTGPSQQLTPTAYISTTFSDPIPFIKRSTLLDESIKELDNKLTTKRRVLKRINPKFSDSEIDQLIEEIEAEQVPSVPVS